MNSILVNLLLCLAFIPTSFAAETLVLKGNFWRCGAFDAENKEWVIDSYYKLTAINKALDACKKQSQIPTSCKTAKETCEAFVNGVSKRPMWQCTALDQMAKAWPSNVYVHRDDAAIAAKAYCRQGSSFPDTCYINLMTCKNLNPNNK